MTHLIPIYILTVLLFVTGAMSEDDTRSRAAVSIVCFVCAKVLVLAGGWYAVHQHGARSSRLESLSHGTA